MSAVPGREERGLQAAGTCVRQWSFAYPFHSVACCGVNAALRVPLTPSNFHCN